MIGQTLGPYQVVSKLGEGGMGEVYRARDTRLARDVAIKVLPAGIVEPERLSRFEQEARAAAALNHPNILAVFDFGAHEGAPFIVTELLEGETLRGRLDAGPMPVRKALAVAVDIARGLAAAHEKGIVHRDLKPENVFVTADERVKILDFGLAKLVGPAEAGPYVQSVGAGFSRLETGAPQTVPGMVLGTVGYMAPEQVRGANADHRSDIFALGAVLYEMLTGERAFRRDTPAETMTAILREDPPPLTSSTRPVPTALDRIVRRCLEKSPGARFQTALDLAFALEALDTATASAVAPLVPARRSGRERAAWIVAAVSLAVALTAFAYLRPSLEQRTLRFAILPPDGWQVDPGSSPGVVAVSPDGRSVAFVARQAGGPPQLLLRSLDALDARVLPGTDGAANPFWSPDSRWVGFLSSGQLKKMDASGRGSPVTLCDAPALSAAWGADGVILFSMPAGGLLRVSDAGGTPEPATTLGPGERQHGRPIFLPGGRRFIYAAIRSGVVAPGAPARQLYATTLGSSDRTLLLESSSTNVLYAAGYLLLLRGSTLVAQPFDADRLAITGDAIPLADDIDQLTQAGGAFGIFSGAPDVLAYRARPTLSVHQLAWFDRTGRQIGLVGERGSYQSLHLMPDGTRAAMGVLDPTRRSRDIWIFDAVRGVRTRFTFDPAEERSVIGSPDGRDIVFNSSRSGALELYRRPSSGAGAEELLLKDGHSKDPMDWSPDGRHVVYRVTGDTQTNDIWALPLFGDRKPVPLMATAFDENYARVSPDGRWMAYGSDESGRVEIYVTAFPQGGGKWQVSTAGGAFPTWRGDGKELYYLAPDNMVTAVAVGGTAAGFEVGMAQGLFRATPPVGPGYPYVVTADGQRFLFNTDVAPTTPLTIVTNWTALLTSR